MQLMQLISKYLHEERKPVVALKGADYQHLLFSTIIKPLLSQNEQSIQVLDPSSLPFATIQGQLAQLFLGQQSIFWLGNIDAVAKKDSEKLKNYLEQYVGPHTVLFFTAKEFTSKECKTIELPQTLSMKEAYSLVQGDEQFAFRVKTFINALYKLAGNLTFDQACIMMQYGALVGRQRSAFFKDWLPKIMVPESSLFTLSTHFFARKPKLFYKEWQKIKDNYPDMFWITYWSEQTWRASQYLKLRPKNFAAAKRIAYRLPFSFINNDWKKVAPTQLKQAHHDLYQIDHDLKNGANGPLLDGWYGSWFG